MATVAETVGMSLPGTALLPAVSGARLTAAEETGTRAVELATEGVAPCDCIERSSLENALRLVCATGGSTNALIHLQALAGRLGITMTVEATRDVCATTPLLTDVRPSGSYDLDDLESAGGVPRSGRLQWPHRGRLKWPHFASVVVDVDLA
jgi:dihydroxy-acid dehydratase